MQEDPSLNLDPPDYTKVNMGLLNRTYDSDTSFDSGSRKTQWERFAHYVRNLNEGSNRNIQYKVLYLARHGESYHNVAQSYYGADCWDCYWSQQEGNGTISWSDAGLNLKGYEQSLAANKFWMDALKTTKIPLPATFYTSPLLRSLITVNLTFSTLPIWTSEPFIPMVKESLRGTIIACTCARRHSKSWIHKNFPNYAFETGFTEEDPLWTPGYSESPSAWTPRAKKLLDDIFSTDCSTFISFTGHGHGIAAILEAIGHPNPKFNLTIGQVIPALVKAEKVENSGCSTSISPPSAVKTCAPCVPSI
ncbi:phosphoglycerate mutase-like protein [Zopfia rhizophila CBS 207.26]|uniref:Phosphoglycerate mutase-like protein n=1 Tax=Zopfia rhizophila CBS 207.26 TaxID=1314779 RepID=A0A6A6E4B6_9PEZI|nr:phosphoglycerate mutase-like protein [Zopfia rhizophila CBS 207.26]